MNRQVNVKGPFGLLLGLLVIILWLVAIFLPAIIILPIAAHTNSLGDWEVWATLVIAQLLWWWLSDAYN